MEPSDKDVIHREVAIIKEVVDAKFDGINRVLSQMGEAISRLTDTVERQSEHQVQLAVLTNTVAHVQATFIEHKMKTDDRLEALEEDQKALSEKVNLRNWKLNAAKAGVGAVAAGGIGFITANFETVLKLFGIS